MEGNGEPPDTSTEMGPRRTGQSDATWGKAQTLGEYPQTEVAEIREEGTPFTHALDMLATRVTEGGDACHSRG